MNTHKSSAERKAWIFTRMQANATLNIQATAPAYAQAFNYASREDAAKALHNILSSQWRNSHHGYPKVERVERGVYKLKASAV